MNKHQRPNWRNRPLPFVDGKGERKPPLLESSQQPGIPWGTFIFAALFFLLALKNFLVYACRPAGIP